MRTDHPQQLDEVLAGGFLRWDASSKQRFLVGGVGACLPMVLQFLALDNTASLSDANMAGVLIRNGLLFGLGGLLAYLHTDEVKPIKLLQIGIAAPALITVMVTGNAAKSPQARPVQAATAAEHRSASPALSWDFFLSSAHAQASQQFVRGRGAGDILSDVVDGITGRAYRGTSYPTETDWVPAARGALPVGLAPAGREAPPASTELYICRAVFANGVHPGKIRPGFAGCNVGWGGREYTSPDYQVLVKHDLSWAPATGGSVPSNAMKAGEEGTPGREPLFICRASYRNGVHPGKVRPGFGGCNIGWGGREEVVARYEVLLGP
ncbi:DM9 repeat-containing protein [Ramlibacter sp. AN1133]|uniref:DM9 repeat-containing protein n=1 Tax=Ramlibacter sp. AN1133 TaxID=3133429 RepID=UPI0030C45259